MLPRKKSMVVHIDLNSRHGFTLRNYWPLFSLNLSSNENVYYNFQVQEENMLCDTGLNPETLQGMCESFTLRPETLYAESNQQYAQCCQTPYVDEEVAICGQNITVGGLEGSIQVIIYKISLSKLLIMNITNEE